MYTINPHGKPTPLGSFIFCPAAEEQKFDAARES